MLELRRAPLLPEVFIFEQENWRRRINASVDKMFFMKQDAQVHFLNVFSLDKELFLSFYQDKSCFHKLLRSFLNLGGKKEKMANIVSSVVHRGRANNKCYILGCIWDLKRINFIYEGPATDT